MSSRKPLWYCHECHAVMRPLMIPDPHCASCNGTFLEKVESDAGDPRSFQRLGPLDGGTASGGGPGIDDTPNSMPGYRRSYNRRTPNSLSFPDRASTGGTDFRSDIDRGLGGSRTILNGGSPALGGNRRRTPREDRHPSGGSLTTQNLLAMLAQRAEREALADPFSSNFFEGPEDGRMGDYVFNQEAFDQIITQSMDQDSSSRPVPATEGVIQQLHREVLEEGSPLLGRDCAVCEDQFALNTEEPDDQVIVTLPCNHPFHNGCIMHWFKSSATCPVCRFQLVPQPGPRPPDGTARRSGAPPPINRATRPDSSSSGNMFGQCRGNGNSSNSRTNRNRPPVHEWDREGVLGVWSD